MDASTGDAQGEAVPSRRPAFGGRPLVTVIIPTYNRRDLLVRALRSVQAQTWPRWEAIVVDDGSADGTDEAVRALDDPRIRRIGDGARHGAGFARALGAGEARGEYLAFLDSDDRWLPDKLERQLAAAEAAGGGPVVIFCPPCSDDGLQLTPVEQPHYEPGRRMADYVYGGQSCTVLSSSLLVDAELGRRVRFSPELRVNQDTDYLLRLEREGARFVCVDEPLYVLDVRRRIDRMGLDPRLRRHSYAWYRRMSADWSPQARRGYLFWDYAMRCAHTGRRDLGVLHLLRGFDRSIGGYLALRQLLRVLFGGDIPRPVKRLARLLRFRRSA